MTPHIESNIEDIAKTVIMPGDPLRAKMIAETYLENVKQVNKIRNILAYTGEYKGKRVTIFSSGMGNPSMGIYSYELYKFYNVEKIIRVGTCGSYKENINLYDNIIVEESYSNSNYLKDLAKLDDNIIRSDIELNEKLEQSAKDLGMSVIKGRIHCTDVFYDSTDISKISNEMNLIATEMETFALFSNALFLNKKAACILTVSDNLITKERASIEERQNSFHKMIKIALESILK